MYVGRPRNRRDELMLPGRSHHAQAEMPRQRIEVTGVVEERMATLDAISADDEVGRLADRHAEPAKPPIVARGARGEIVVEKGNGGITAQAMLDARRGGVVAGALENFEQSKIAD